MNYKGFMSIPWTFFPFDLQLHQRSFFLTRIRRSNPKKYSMNFWENHIFKLVQKSISKIIQMSSWILFKWSCLNLLSNQNEVLSKHIIIIEPFQSPYTKLLSKLQSIIFYFKSYLLLFSWLWIFFKCKKYTFKSIFSNSSPYRQIF